MGDVVRTVTRDGVGHVLLDRPDAMNAITVELGAQLYDGLIGLDADPEAHVIVIRGAGGNFCVGGDFGEVERLRVDGADALRPLFENFGRACAAIAHMATPVISAVEGYAMAGGFELMQASDVVVVSSGARIADNHSNFGQLPGGGSSQRLPRLVGRQQALGLILSGDRITGEQAVAMGLAYRAWPTDRFDDELAAFVTALAEKDSVTLTGIKRLVLDGLALPLEHGLALERDRVVEHITGAAGRTGIEKFTSRRSRSLT